VLLAIRAHVLTWPLGIVANVLLLALFFQIRLYSDMLLQCYYILVSLWGWWLWRRRGPRKPLEISQLSSAHRLAIGAASAVAIVALGSSAGRLYLWLPSFFPQPASFPFADATTTVLSVVATLLLAGKRIENWYLWLAVDAICVYLYASKGVHLMAAEYGLFFVMAAFGLARWRRLTVASVDTGRVQSIG
jgi:nicotinamide mononucleotide transporter